MALSLLKEMRELGLPPDHISFGATVSACAVVALFVPVAYIQTSLSAFRVGILSLL